MLNIPELVGAVQRNCDISDAQHAREAGLCTYLLRMREYYRWEHDIPYFRSLPGAELGEWLSARERLWSELETSSYQPVPLESESCDPFDTAAINRELIPRGLVYSGGYGSRRQPHFFLGQLRHREQRAGLTVLVSSCEYARDLVAPPAMLQGRTVFVRQESLRRMLWERYEEWAGRRRDNAMGRAFAAYDFAADPEAALARMTENETATLILHELGEVLAGERLGERWGQLLLDLTDARSERLARAVRDHLADCLSTLPALLERDNAASLHFFFANLDGLRKDLFPAALAAYERWIGTGDSAALRSVIAAGREHWQKSTEQLMAAIEADRANPGAALRALEERIRL